MGQIIQRAQKLAELSDEISALNRQIIKTAEAGDPVDPADHKKLSRLVAELERLPRRDTAIDSQVFTRIHASEDNASSDQC